MKSIIIALIIVLLFGCSNDSVNQTEIDATDSTEAVSFSRLAAIAAPGSTVIVDKLILQNLSDANKPDTAIYIQYINAALGWDSVRKELHQYKAPIPSDNQPPSVKTGPDQTITLPTNSVTLNGSGSNDPDGTISSYKWEKTKGNAATLVTVGAICNVSGLSGGDYTFKLTVADNWGVTASDTIHVTVKGGTPPPPANIPPTVSAGSNQTITLPINSVTLAGTATDPDGTVVLVQWSKVSGPGGPVSGGTTKTLVVTNLVAGTYVYNLRATDNNGAIGNSTVTVTVVANTPPPAGYTLTFSTGYDTMGDMLYGGNGQYGNGTISTTTYKTGPGSFYSRPAQVSSGTRSEVQYTDAAQNPTEGAVEWDVFYEVIIPGNGCSIQWHPNTSGSSGSPYLMHDGGKFTWVVWKGGANTYYPLNIIIPSGRWIHMRVEYKFGTPNQGGYLKHWMDGTQVLNKTAIQLGDGSGQYLKVGYNGWDANSTSGRIYYDNLKVYKKG